MLDYFSQLVQVIVEPFTYFNSPNKRIYWLYLLCALGLTFVVLIKNGNKWQWFDKSYWFNKSTAVDIKWIATNQCLAFILLVPLLSGQLAWAMSTYRQLTQIFGTGDIIRWSPVPVMILFTVVLFICEDFSRFIVHYAYHKVPFLWRFHAIHHSAEVMNPLTLYRIHFIEYVINMLRALLITGFVSGVFMYLFVGRIGIYEVLGVSIFNLLFNLAGSNLRHSHIWLGFGKFENLFISPAQHQIHHSSSKKHLDKNFGASLAIWDKLFNSWQKSQGQSVSKFGLYQQQTKQSLRAQIKGIKT